MITAQRACYAEASDALDVFTDKLLEEGLIRSHVSKADLAELNPRMRDPRNVLRLRAYWFGRDKERALIQHVSYVREEIDTRVRVMQLFTKATPKGHYLIMRFNLLDDTGREFSWAHKIMFLTNTERTFFNLLLGHRNENKAKPIDLHLRTVQVQTRKGQTFMRHIWGFVPGCELNNALLNSSYPTADVLDEAVGANG